MKVAVLGSFVADLMARAPGFPKPGETVKGSLFQMGPGGKGFNQAVAAHRAGGKVVFSTKVGRDSFGELALNTLQEEGMDDQYVFQTEHAPTGAALITVDDESGQNEIVVVPGACDTFTEGEINRFAKTLEGYEYLLLQLEINRDAVELLAKLAVERGVRVILNPAPIQPAVNSLYPLLYAVTPNEVEAESLTGIHCDDGASCRRAAEVLREQGVEKVVITLGERGVYAFDGIREAEFSNYDVPVLDATGAGDAFNGGMLAALGNGMDFLGAVAFGNLVANLSVTKLGTALAMPSKDEIAAFQVDHPLAVD